MNQGKEKCQLIDKEVRACTLKSAWVDCCQYKLDCMVKRKYRQRENLGSRKITVCNVLDCSNNIKGKCDNIHEINKVGFCITYGFNREWFKRTLTEKVKGGIL